jgi:hypothetical protein
MKYEWIRFLLPWEKVVGETDRMRESRRHRSFSLISQAPPDSFSHREKRKVSQAPKNPFIFLKNPSLSGWVWAELSLSNSASSSRWRRVRFCGVSTWAWM